MEAVHRYSIGLDVNDIKMPRWAVVLRVGVRPADGIPSIWARVNIRETSQEVRRFFVVGTGHEFDEKATYIGTFETGAFVWHVFEAVKP